MNVLTSDAERAHLENIVAGKQLLRSSREQTLADLCLMYSRKPAGESGFALRTVIRTIVETESKVYGNDTRLMEIAVKMVPQESLSLKMPYELD